MAPSSEFMKDLHARRRAERTHFACGHEITPVNTYTNPLGSATCRDCKRASQAAYKEKIRVSRPARETKAPKRPYVRSAESRRPGTRNRRAVSRWERYGVDQKTYDSMLRAQHRSCLDCRMPLLMLDPKDVHIDHCHVSGAVRAILCSRCNMARGLVDESPTVLQRMARNLSSQKAG